MKKGSATIAGIFLVAFMALTLVLISDNSSITGNYIYTNQSCSWPASGDWVIDSIEVRCVDANITVNGNLNVSGTGKLILEESELRINASFVNEFSLYVNDSANFTILSSTISHEGSTYQINIFDNAIYNVYHSIFSNSVSNLLSDNTNNYIYNSSFAHNFITEKNSVNYFELFTLNTSQGFDLTESSNNTFVDSVIDVSTADFKNNINFLNNTLVYGDINFRLSSSKNYFYNSSLEWIRIFQNTPVFYGNYTLLNKTSPQFFAGSTIRYFPVVVTYPNSDVPVPNKAVNITNSTGDLVWSGTTDSNGYVEANITFTSSAHLTDFTISTNSSEAIGLLSDTPITLEASDYEAPTYSSQSNPSTPQTYSPTNNYNFSVDWVDNVLVSDVIFEIDGTNYTYLNSQINKNGNNFWIDFVGLNAGTYQTKWYSNDTSNNFNSTNSFNLVINKVANPLTLTSIPSWSVTYPNNVLVSCSSLSGTPELHINDTLVANPYSSIQGVGTYNYSCNVTTSTNYLANQTYNVLNVNQNTSSCSLVFDKVSPQVYGTQINASCSCSNPETTSYLFRDGADVTTENNLLVTLGAANYNYVCNATSSQNYTAASNSTQFNITQASTLLSFNVDPATSITYETESNVSCFADNSEVVVALYRNDALVSNPDIQTLGASYYNYTCNTTGSQNYSLSNNTQGLTVNKKTSSVDLTLNGVSNNVTVAINQNVTIFGNLTDGLGNIVIKENSVIIHNGATYLQNVSYSSGQLVNITLEYLGNENYTFISKTYWINVSDTTSPILNYVNPTPLSRTIYDNFTVNVSVVDDGAVDQCWLVWYHNASLLPMTKSGNYCYITLEGLVRGTSYGFNAKANDTLGNVGSAGIRNVLYNRLTTNPTPSIQPNPAYTNDTLICVNQTSADPDGDSVIANYVWYKNGSLLPVITQTLASSYFNKTDNVTCYNIFDDGYENVTTANTSIIIQNVGPTLDSIGTLNSYEDSLFTYDVNASDLDFDAITFSDNSSLFVINPLTGIFSFTPTNSDVGVYSINVSVTDGSLVDYEIITLNVLNTNDAPVITQQNMYNETINTTASIVNITENQTYNFTVNVTDDDSGDTNVVSWFVDNVFQQVGNVFTYLFGFFSEGERNVTALVNDSLNATDSVSWTINVSNVNRDPVINTTNQALNPSVDENTTTTFNITYYDLDNNNISIDWLLNGTLVATNISEYNFTTNFTDAGTYNLTVIIVDDFGSNDSLSFAITVNNVNRAPIGNMANMTWLEDNMATINLSDYFVDPDGDSFYLDQFLVNNMTLLNSSLISMVPSQDWFGQQYTTMRVCDTFGACYTTDPFVLKVISVPDVIGSEFNHTGIDSANLTIVNDLGIKTAQVVLDNSFGLINFTEEINYTQDRDLDTFIELSNNLAEVINIPEMNVSAIVTLTGLTLTNPRVMRNSVECSSSICTEISYVGGNFTFSVKAWSSYSSSETPVPVVVPVSSGGGGGGGSSGCTESWSCTDWSDCVSLSQSRTCNDIRNCGTTRSKPEEIRTCTEECVWDCSDWASCTDGYETRTCSSSGDCGLSPIVKQVCGDYSGDICRMNWTCDPTNECFNGRQDYLCSDKNSCIPDEREETRLCSNVGLVTEYPAGTCTNNSWFLLVTFLIIFVAQQMYYDDYLNKKIYPKNQLLMFSMVVIEIILLTLMILTQCNKYLDILSLSFLVFVVYQLIMLLKKVYRSKDIGLPELNLLKKYDSHMSKEFKRQDSRIDKMVRSIKLIKSKEKKQDELVENIEKYLVEIKISVKDENRRKAVRSYNLMRKSFGKLDIIHQNKYYSKCEKVHNLIVNYFYDV